MLRFEETQPALIELAHELIGKKCFAEAVALLNDNSTLLGSQDWELTSADSCLQLQCMDLAAATKLMNDLVAEACVKLSLSEDFKKNLFRIRGASVCTSLQLLTAATVYNKPFEEKNLVLTNMRNNLTQYHNSQQTQSSFSFIPAHYLAFDTPLANAQRALSAFLGHACKVRTIGDVDYLVTRTATNESCRSMSRILLAAFPELKQELAVSRLNPNFQRVRVSASELNLALKQLQVKRFTFTNAYNSTTGVFSSIMEAVDERPLQHGPAVVAPAMGLRGLFCLGGHSRPAASRPVEPKISYPSSTAGEGIGAKVPGLSAEAKGGAGGSVSKPQSFKP